MMIGKAGEAHSANGRYATSCIAVAPLPPENALMQIEYPAMFELFAGVELQRGAVCRNRAEANREHAPAQ